MTNVLGIDTGGKAVGLAVVEQPTNNVLFCGTLHLSDRIKDLYDQRRTLRRARRARVRYRRPKVPQRGGAASGGSQEKATYFYRRAKGLNQSLRTRCKYVDPGTGEVCAKNSPKKSNVRHLLLEDILTFAPLADVAKEYKQALRDVLASREGIARRQQRLGDILSRIDINADLRKQIRDIAFNPLSGRTEFCREHILAHHAQTTIPANVIWLPPSIRLKQEFVLKAIRRLARRFHIDRIIVERAGFDLQKIAKGVIEDPTEYQRGYRFGFRNTRAALLQEYSGRCCYCGKKVLGKKWHVDHIDPRREGEVNRWENLAIACEKCNHQKGGRNPRDAGMTFSTFTEKLAGRSIRRSLRPKPLAETRIHKYMTQTDQGIRIFERQLRALCPGAPIEHTFGYVTSVWRQLWGLEKGKERNEHHNDAIVIASRHAPGANPTLDVHPQTSRQQLGGKRLFDLNPVHRANDGRYYQRVPIAAEVGGIKRAQLKSVVDPHKRRLLEREFARYEVTGSRSLPAAALQRLPFKSVRLRKRDCTDTNVREMGNGHRYKVSNVGGTRVNEAVVVYRDQQGHLGAYVVKNRRIFQRTPVPGDCREVVARFGHGDSVCAGDGTVLGRITQIASNGTLTLNSGRTRRPLRCKKGGG